MYFLNKISVPRSKIFQQLRLNQSFNKSNNLFNFNNKIFKSSYSTLNVNRPSYNINNIKSINKTLINNSNNKIHILNIIRNNSTDTKKVSTKNTNTEQIKPISWTEFFNYRKSIKNYEIAGLVIGSFIGFSAGLFYFMMVAEFDPTQQLFGLQDPTLLYFMGVFGTAAIIGFIGSQLGLIVRRITKQKSFIKSIDTKESDFYRRILKHRPKEIAAVVPIPGAQQSGMPDYYGEKIFSIKDYRDWLKKQRKFKISRELKRKGF